MKYKKGIVLICLLICLFSIGSVVASDVNETTVANEYQSNEIISVDENIDNVNSIEKPEMVNDYENKILDDNGLNSYVDDLSELEDNDKNKKSILNQKDILSLGNNDNELSASLIKTEISVSDYSITLNPTSTYFTISTLSAKVKTTSGQLVNTGAVYFVIDTYGNSIKTFDTGVEKGVASYTYSYKAYYSPGKYLCTAYYSDFSNRYESSSCNFYLTVKTKTELSVADIKCNLGNSITIRSSLKSGTGRDASKYGNIEYVINSQRYSTSGSLGITMNTPGKIKCTAQYVGNSYYLTSSEKTFYITVNDQTNVVYSLDSNRVLAGDYFNLNYRVVDGSGNTVPFGEVKITESTMLLMATAYYDSLKSYSTSGYVSLASPNKPGQYTYGIYYKNSNYQGTSKTFKLNVYSKSIITSSTIKSYVGKTANIKLIVKDHLGQKINEGIIKSNFNGKSYSASVKNGEAIFNNVKMPLKGNTYYCTAYYSTDSGLYTSSSCIIKIICSHESKIKVNTVKGYAGKKVKLSATIKDGLGNKIKKGTIKFKINGKTYKSKVKNGKATKKIKIPKAKISKKISKTNGNIRTVKTYYKTTYSCTATFSGYKQFPSSSSTFKVVSKKKPKIHTYKISKKKSSTKTTKTKKSTSPGTIFINNDQYRFWFNYNGNTLGNMPVKFKIYSGSNYDEYDSQTDGLGFVTIYNIPKGEHKIYIEGHYLLDSKTYHSTFTINRVK